jgi:Spy/CpxP family protein refolding chaperone
MRRTTERVNAPSRARRRAALCCLALIAGLSAWSVSVEAQRPRVGLGARRLERQQKKAERQAVREPGAATSAGAGESASGQGAQAAGPQDGVQEGGASFTREEMLLIPRGLPARVLGRVFRQLDLSADQRQRLRQLGFKYGNQLPVLTRLQRAQNEALDEALYGQNFDPQLVEQRAADLAATQAEIVKTRAKIMTELRQVLTPDQALRFRALLEQERTRMLQEGIANPGQANQF